MKRYLGQEYDKDGNLLKHTERHDSMDYTPKYASIVLEALMVIAMIMFTAFIVAICSIGLIRFIGSAYSYYFPGDRTTISR